MKITVCNGFSCRDKGSEFILDDLRRLIARHDLEDVVTLQPRACMGKCQKGVCVLLDDEFISLMPSDTQDFFKQRVLPNAR